MNNFLGRIRLWWYGNPRDLRIRHSDGRLYRYPAEHIPRIISLAAQHHETVSMFLELGGYQEFILANPVRVVKPVA